MKLLGRNCERDGHAEVYEGRQFYLHPSRRGGVADEATGTRWVCGGFFCKAAGPWEWSEDSRMAIHELSMDAERWRKLKERGWLVAQ